MNINDVNKGLVDWWENNTKPKPPFTLVETVITKQVPLALYLLIVFVDADGKKWTAQSGHFVHDLKEHKG